VSEQAPVALVTGGSRGIGRACALAAAERGADVAITYIANAEAAEATAEEIRAHGRRAMTIQGDVGVPADNVAAVEATVAELGRSATSSPTPPTARSG
jgi:3-oxoacyl-[acyl-carrier protein] reductase